MSTASWDDEELVLEFPSKLPMEFVYKQELFYVRNCYLSFYEAVLRWLLHMKVVAVTGARGEHDIFRALDLAGGSSNYCAFAAQHAGVGKSVFYAYFFLRYSTEFPLVTIITASFTEASKLTKVMAWRSGVVIGEAEGNATQMIRTIRKARKEAKHGAIYLFDGWQPDLSLLDADVVCFARPNDKWFIDFTRSVRHIQLVMPLWGREELHDAAVFLGLEMQDSGEFIVDRDGKVIAVPDRVQNCVEERFFLFGGVARECLSTDAAYVNARKRFFEDIIANLTEEATRFVAHCPDPNLAQYGIFHYAPLERNPIFRYKLEEASPFVRELIEARLKQLDADEKKRQATCCTIL
jgi:hypothetical protein